MAKRIGQSSVNWAAIAERVPAEQRTSFSAFKSRSDIYLRRMMANPPEPPKIDWAAYRKAVPVPGMVDNFEKQYSTLKIDYPKDTLSSAVDAQWAEIQKTIAQFCKESNDNIAKYQEEIAKTNAMLPYEQMTLEDYAIAYPDRALDPINRPTWWPHDAETQAENEPIRTKPPPSSDH